MVEIDALSLVVKTGRLNGLIEMAAVGVAAGDPAATAVGASAARKRPLWGRRADRRRTGVWQGAFPLEREL
jgi:hypothetical protein